VSDFWVEKRLGKARAKWTYPFKKLIHQGVFVVGGSDCPVEPISPLLGIYAAVNREISPQERITVEEALSLYTINAAYASFEEKIKGSIESGKLADLAVLSDDLQKIEPSRIKDVKVEMTIVGGKVVYTIS
jgi:predicted amidohydrolase YtcJ